MRIAITREVSRSIGRCELSHLDRVPIDVDRLRAQHREYERMLVELGCRVHRIPEAPDLPDAVFVEDAAIIVDEIAIVTRPGAASRRAETPDVAERLARFRMLRFVDEPATIDGGDVLRVGRTLFVGRSARTNDAGIAAMSRLLVPLGYRVRAVPVGHCLHLKSAATRVGRETVLVNPAWVDVRAFESLERLEIDPSEPFAANALLVGTAVVTAKACPRTRALLEDRGYDVRALDVSEIAKAEGALTCCSVIIDA